MRILFVTPYPISRIRVRSYGFVTQLAKRHDLEVLALCAGEKDMADMESLQREGIAITPVDEIRTRQYLRSLRAIGTQLPLQVAFAAAPGLRAAISQRLATGHFDVLHVELLRSLGALPNYLPVPVVWDAVDCVSHLYREGERFGATPTMRIVGWSESGRLAAYEYEQLRRFRHVLVTSERERQALMALPGGGVTSAMGHAFAEITVIPNGVDQQYFQCYRGRRRAETLVISGKMSFHANVAAVHHLMEHILPHIWEQRPGVRLIIAGSDPTAWVCQLTRDPRIEVTGYVPDLRPYIAQAQISVSPLPYAVGIQNKVLEAMALGTPVVASASAVGGLQVVDGRDLLIANEPEAFAGAVLRLLDDTALRSQLAENGLIYVAECHNWDAIVDQLASVYARATLDTTDVRVPVDLGVERGSDGRQKAAGRSWRGANSSG
jgi:glycosyltransferase involved in cell wall biosynthesis